MSLNCRMPTHVLHAIDKSLWPCHVMLPIFRSHCIELHSAQQKKKKKCSLRSNIILVFTKPYSYKNYYSYNYVYWINDYLMIIMIGLTDNANNMLTNFMDKTFSQYRSILKLAKQRSKVSNQYMINISQKRCHQPINF